MQKDTIVKSFIKRTMPKTERIHIILENRFSLTRNVKNPKFWFEKTNFFRSKKSQCRKILMFHPRLKLLKVKGYPFTERELPKKGHTMPKSRIFLDY